MTLIGRVNPIGGLAAAVNPVGALKASMTPTFPARVVGSTGITITKSGGVYTFSWSVTSLSELLTLPLGDYDNVLVPVWNEDTQTFRTISVETLIASLAGNLDAAIVNAALTAIFFTAGDGLTGGGTLVANRTFAVGAGSGITVNPDNVALTDIANLALLANVSGSSAAPAEVLLSDAALRAGLNYWTLSGSEISYGARASLSYASPAFRLISTTPTTGRSYSWFNDGTNGTLTLDDDTAGVSRIFVNPTGQVGIGGAPTAPFHVQTTGVTGQGFRLSGTAARFTAAASDSSNSWNWDNDAGQFRLFRENYSAAGPGAGGLVAFRVSDKGHISTLPDGVANAGMYGDPTGATSSSAGIVTAYGLADTVYFPPGTYTLGTTATWPAGKTYVFARGAILKPSSGVDTTILGPVVIDHWEQCFDLSNGGGCSIVGIKHTRQEWWGATGDGTTNDQPACQAAHDCTEAATASEGGHHVIEARSGKVYALGSTLQWRPTSTFPLQFEGRAGALVDGGVVYLAKSTFTDSVAIHVMGNASGWGSYRLRGFQIFNQTAGSGPSTGLLVGTDYGARLENNKQNLIEEFRVSGFAINIYIRNSRVLAFSRFSTAPYDFSGAEAASGTGLLISVVGNGTDYANSSDMDFYDYQCESAYGFDLPSAGQNTPSGMGVQITSTTANTAVAGIRFHRIVAYGGEQQISIVAAGGASVGDIWIQPGSQFEGPLRETSVATRALVIVASDASSTVGDIHFSSLYLSGNGFQKTVEATVASSGVIHTVFVNNNNMPSSGLESVIMNGSGGTVKAIHVNGNIIRGVAAAAGTVISLANVTNANCNDNTLADCTGLTNFILWSGASNHFVSHGNSAGGCATNSVANTATGSPTFSVANNI